MCFHKWNKWSKLVPNTSTMYLSQFKNCSKCNKIKLRYIQMNKLLMITSGQIRSDYINDILKENKLD